MKKIIIPIAIVIVIAALFFMIPSDKQPVTDGLWENALYTEDTSFGDGEKEVSVTVVAGENDVVLTLHSDKDNLGDALLEHGLVEGEDGPYGLYIKSVNGIVADYDIDKTYWSLSKEGDYMTTGVSETTFEDGDSFELTRLN